MILRPVAPPVEYGVTKRLARAGNAAIAFLRTLGTSAHVWLPGANGVNVASLPSNNYLLSDGSTGYSTVDGVDGLTLDGMGSLGAEKVINGSAFVDTTGWIVGSGGSGGAISVAAGELVCTATAGGFITSTPFTTVIGNTYKMVGTGRKGTYTGSPQFGFSATVTGIPSPMVTFTTTSNETKELYFVATATTSYAIIRFPTIENGATAYFDDISCKPYTGTHLTQATTANKPLVRRGMLNLLTYSRDFTTGWTNFGATLTAGQTDPYGGTTATLVNQTAGGSMAKTTTAVVVGNVYTACFICKQGSSTKTGIELTGGVVGNLIITHATLALTVSGAFSGATVSDLGSGWLLVAAKSTAATTTNVGTYAYGDGDFGGPTGSSYFCGIGLTLGTWTAAQILAEGGIPTTTATAASNPTSGKYWWSFDGSNDILVASSVPLQIADDCAVIAGVCVNTAAATKIVFSERSNVSGTPIVASLSVDATNKPGFSVRNDAATLAAAASPEALTAPAVIAGRQVGNVRVIRVNGIQKATDTTALGSSSAVTTASVGAHNLGAPVDFFNGSISIVIVIKGTLTDAEMLILERFAASVTPGAPVF